MGRGEKLLLVGEMPKIVEELRADVGFKSSDDGVEFCAIVVKKIVNRF